MTCQLTASVECVADMMYQLTLMKFMPLPNSDTNIAVKKNRKARWLQRSDQSTRCAVAVAMEPTSLQNSESAETAERNSLTAAEAPSSVAYGNPLHIHLRYDVQNHANNDYSVSSSSRLRVMGRYANGSLTTPLEDETVSIELPVFIPARHTGMITLEFNSVIPVAKQDKQTEEEYRMQLRSLLLRTRWLG